MNEKLAFLTVDLPEDVAKLKAYGDFDRAIRVINKKLEKKLPQALRERLELEKILLPTIAPGFPYTYQQALEKLQAAFTNFTEEEMNSWWEEDALDWIYIKGEVHFKEDMVANLVKTRPHLAPRVINKKDLTDKEGNFTLLDGATKKMRSQGSLAYKIRLKAGLKIKTEAERLGKTIQVHIPLPVEYAQVKNFKLISVSPLPTLINAGDYPHRTVYFEKALEKGEVFSVEYEYENHMKYTPHAPEAVLKDQPTFYTEEQAPHIMFTPYIKHLAQEIIGSETNPLLKARKMYDFVTTRVMYSFVRPYITITDIPNYAATSLKGDCGIQALLFITLCRAVGIPARWQAGLYTCPLSVGNHDWAQYYVAPFGWLFADCSFGGSAWRAGAEDRWDFYSRNLEPFRMPAASEFQHEFNPPFNFMRNDPYDNQGGEAQYTDMPLSNAQYEVFHTITHIEEIK